MRNKANQTNIDKSDLTNYPNGRIKNDGGSGDGTAVNEQTKGDIHEFFDKLLRLYGVSHNGLPDNETNGYQSIEALKGFANKNNYVYDLSSSSGVLTLPLKVGKLNNNEIFTVKASQDKNGETTLKGTLDNVTKIVSFFGDYKAGDYLKVINTDYGINIIRSVDYSNFEVVATELGFLKKATGDEVVSGVIDTKAVTPESFLYAFAKMVVGDESDDYIATILHNGLLSKEDKEKLDSFEGGVYGTVFVGDVDAGLVGDTYTISGDFASASIVERTSTGQVVEVTLNEPLETVNYTVNSSVESLGNFSSDNEIRPVVWRVVSTSKFRFFIDENPEYASSQESQNIKLHFDIKQR